MTLTSKQELFIEEYLVCFNATKAALAAGYSSKTAHATGWENLRKPDISEVISRRLSEAAMSADEVLKRLASHARGSMGDFIKVTPQGPQFDFQSPNALDNLHLIKRLKTKTRTITVKNDDSDKEDGFITEVDVEFELYDAQAALEKLGRHHKLFTDRSEILNIDLSKLPDEQLIRIANGEDPLQVIASGYIVTTTG